MRGDVRGQCPDCGCDLVETTSGTQIVCSSPFRACTYYERLSPDGSRVALSLVDSRRRRGAK